MVVSELAAMVVFLRLVCSTDGKQLLPKSICCFKQINIYAIRDLSGAADIFCIFVTKPNETPHHVLHGQIESRKDNVVHVFGGGQITDFRTGL